MNECILWTGPVHSMGYGRVDRTRLAHRVAWEREHGPVPAGHVIHHRCAKKLCVNVDHLECLTHAEHNAFHVNAKTWHDQQRAKTHCPQGHEYTPENTMMKRGHRHCRACARAYSSAYHKANRERILPQMRERERLRRAAKKAAA